MLLSLRKNLYEDCPLKLKLDLKPNAQMKKKSKGNTPKTNKGKKAAKKVNVTTVVRTDNWKRNCPNYLAEKKPEKEAQGKYDLLGIET